MTSIGKLVTFWKLPLLKYEFVKSMKVIKQCKEILDRKK